MEKEIKMAKSCGAKKLAKKVVQHEKAELKEDKKDTKNDRRLLSAAKKVAKKK